MTATTIDEILDQLTTIVETCRRDGSRNGYFACLYRGVTREVKARVTAGHYEDNPRMERLVVAFANRYLDAYECYRRGEPCSKAWHVAFRQAELPSFLVLQHLMFSMNAHIYLDLGIVAAETAPGETLPGLELDFIAINHLLASMVDAVQDRLAAVSPWLGWLDVVGGGHDETVANFNMRAARDSAWNFALKLAAQTEAERAATIKRRDAAVADLASIITRPGLTLGAAIFLIWLRESREASYIIEVMSGT